MATKVLISQIEEHVALYRDPETGIAWVENGHTGMGHSAHPNISAGGSVRGMRDRGYWTKDARTRKSHGFIYNIDERAVESDPYDRLAAAHCMCDACVERRGTPVTPPLVDRSEQVAVEGDAWEVEDAWKRGYYASSSRGQFYDCFAQGYLMGKLRSRARINAVREVLETQGRYRDAGG